ncbi:cryptococcal mannosyltransferase 1-domain-containing protein [Chaetomium fimeti]|uniref:Cryptococcal mannosyltransferase 1-domain-containing protein n=1 Tax=Chaetomium fimeti TaxID=1854472 RepID=A0AAE0HEL6_9PEZI|nr:cryptococcal mannosyltransferase 1-domain-containing protein [Chaetomium fimeti]
MRRSILLLWPTACLLLVAVTLYVRRDQFTTAYFTQSHLSRPDGGDKHLPSQTGVLPSATSSGNQPALPLETTALYVKAIMNIDTATLPHLECPKLDPSRYQQLQVTNDASEATIRYFFALDLRQCVALLPRLIGSVVEAMRFLGPTNCALSIIEGNSKDGTGEVLAALLPELEALGVTYYFSTTAINPKKGDRITALAQLRNLAIQPLLDDTSITTSPTTPKPQRRTPPKPKYDPATTTIIFLNDVAICPEDILELVLQHTTLNADMVCAMDWTYVGADPTFYDVWIARALSGDAFFEIPPDGSWDSAWNLFWNDEASRARLGARQPFQVFSCWNGAVVFKAAPVMEGGVRFRRARKGECHQGEPQLFCKDLWFGGYGKIAVVPVVNLEYSDEGGRKIKEAKGYTSRWVGSSDWRDEGIEWQTDPPEKVKCTAQYDNQFFEAWNKTQPGT